MTTNVKQSNAKQSGFSGAVQTVEKDVRPLQAFWTKFSNDWSMNFAAALAYNLMMAMFPIAIAILSILGFFLGTLDPHAHDNLIKNIQGLLPSQVSGSVITQIEDQLRKNAGVFGFIAIILALYNGSRLFVLIEGIFGIIYHVRQRKFLQQNMMALGMLLLFILLIPIMTFAAAAPTFVLTILQKTPLGNLPGSGILFTVFGLLGGLLAAFIFFLAIYVVVPNQHISFRNSWLGSLVAAIALQLYLVLFPLYVAQSLKNYAGAGPISLVILLIFFYYFAVILLLGAEVNAFFAEKVEATPQDIVTMIHLTTSHLPKKPEDQQKQAAASHKNEQTGSVAEKGEDTSKKGGYDTKGQVAAITTAATPEHQEQQAASKPVYVEQKVEKVKEKKQKPSKVVTVAEAAAGTALAFLLEWFNMRRRKPQ